MKTQNKNFIYNVIYQIFIFIIPMISTPYISRVLGVDAVGTYSFTYSIVYYFMLFSMLGINNYGARTIAKNVDNKDKLNKEFTSIYILQLILNIISIFLYILFISVSNYSDKNIMTVQLIFLISVAFDINWFFFGLEKFKITISRNIIIKILSLVMIFVFIKESSDLWKYTLIMSLSTLISQLYLWLFVKRETRFVHVSVCDIYKNLKPCLVLFIPVISYSIYRVMDKTMIGIFANTIELGNYESAEKIINIPISFVTALGTVMLPHMSKKSENEIKKSIYSTFELTFFMVLPMVIGLLLVSNNFSNLFFGDEFLKTGMLIKYLSFTIIFASIANVVRTNYLIPMQKDSIYVNSTIVGAIVNLICNLIFIKKYGAYGACIGTILAEFTLMLYQVIHTRHFIDVKKVGLIFNKYLIKSIIVGVIIFILGIIIDNSIIRLVIQIIVAIIVYIILNYSYILYDFLGRKKKRE